MDPSFSEPLSIGIPAYNSGAALVPLLEAVVSQSDPADDLFVVDDASTDNTAAVVDAFPRFRLLRNVRNLGMVGNWNACLDAARHDWVCLLHHDDELGSGALATMRRACALASGPMLIAHRREGADTDNRFRYRRCEPGPWAVLHVPTIPSGAILHRAIISDLGAFDPQWQYSSDLEYFARICTRYPLLIIESPDVVRYRLHQQNHQYQTWHRPDFDDQMRALQRAVLGYAGFSGESADRLLEDRMTAMYFHMFMATRRLGDRTLLRGIARRYGRRRGLNVRLRILAALAAVTGWTPQPRHDFLGVRRDHADSP